MNVRHCFESEKVAGKSEDEDTCSECGRNFRDTEVHTHSHICKNCGKEICHKDYKEKELTCECGYVLIDN